MMGMQQKKHPGGRKKKQDADAFGCNLNCKNLVRAKGFSKTGEHTRMKRKRGGWDCVPVYVVQGRDTPRPIITPWWE